MVSLNGTALQQVDDGMFVEAKSQQGPAGSIPSCIEVTALGALCSKRKARETLPSGVTYSVLDFSMTRLDQTQVFTVPAGHFFVLGDNRDNSLDSRVAQSTGGLGFIPQENVVGTAEIILFSSAGRAIWDVTKWRSDRYLKVVEQDRRL